MSPEPPANPSADGPISLVMDRFSSRRRLVDVEQCMAMLSKRQHGVVSLGQLRSMGLTETAVQQRAAVGRLHRIHQGVYATGHSPLSQEARFIAAVLASGDGATLSHRSAATLWRVRAETAVSVDVTAPNRRGRVPRGIEAHRHGSLRAEDRTLVRGIPCTTVERTLLDLAGVVPVWELGKAIAEAEVLGILDHAALRGLIRRSRGRRGVARLRMLLDELNPAVKRTRSELERRFLRMCDSASLPQPEVNVELELSGGRLEVDFLWRDAGLIVEADGRRFHGTASAFQHDRRREQRLQLEGWRVTRCSWEQVANEPHRLATTIRALLTQPNPRRRA